MCFCACLATPVFRCLYLCGGPNVDSVPEYSSLNLLGALSSVTQGTKLGTALEMANAISKVEHLTIDLHKLAPHVHQMLNTKISEIIGTLGDAMDQLGQVIEPTTRKKRSSFDLLGPLGSAAKGTTLGTTIEMVNAITKMEQLIGDLKNLAPNVLHILTASIIDTETLLENIIDQLGQSTDLTSYKEHSGFGLLGALGSATKGTKLGTAMEMVGAITHVEQLITDLKDMAPNLHQALNANITDIETTLGHIIDQLGQAVDGATSSDHSCFNWLGALGLVTHGGTTLETALEMVNAITEVEQLIDDLKTLAPSMHRAVRASISEIETTLGDVID